MTAHTQGSPIVKYIQWVRDAIPILLSHVVHMAHAQSLKYKQDNIPTQASYVPWMLQPFFLIQKLTISASISNIWASKVQFFPDWLNHNSILQFCLTLCTVNF